MQPLPVEWRDLGRRLVDSCKVASAGGGARRPTHRPYSEEETHESQNRDLATWALHSALLELSQYKDHNGVVCKNGEIVATCGLHPPFLFTKK